MLCEEILDEGLQGRNVLHSLREHSCALMLNKFVLNSMRVARMSLYTIVSMHGLDRI